jgi:hypothetical protein
MNPPTAPTTRREAFTTAGLALPAASVTSPAQAAEAESIGPDHFKGQPVTDESGGKGRFVLQGNAEVPITAKTPEGAPSAKQ